MQLLLRQKPFLGLLVLVFCMKNLVWTTILAGCFYNIEQDIVGEQAFEPIESSKNPRQNRFVEGCAIIVCAGLATVFLSGGMFAQVLVWLERRPNHVLQTDAGCRAPRDGVNQSCLLFGQYFFLFCDLVQLATASAAAVFFLSRFVFSTRQEKRPTETLLHELNSKTY